MSSVNILSQDATSYLKDIIQARRERQDERLEDGLKSGKVSGRNKETLLDLQEKNDALVDKALEDGKVSRDEYNRIMKALDEQNKLLDRFVKTRDAAKADERPMENQEQILSILYGRMDRIEAALDKGLESGRIDAEERKKIEASMGKARELLDAAMEDGTISKSELSAISKAQNVLNREVVSYGRNRRYSGPSTRQQAAMNVKA